VAKRSSPPPGPDDAELWNRVARDVRPIKRARTVKTPVIATGKQQPPSASKPKPAAPRASVAPRAAPPVTPPPPPLAAGTAPGLDKRNQTRLRRGRLPIDGRIDLHGMRLEEARAALLAFLAAQFQRGSRCVLIITGKGERGRGTGVIRAALPQWLNDGALRPGVVAFAEAQPKDGGSGAFYLYLRRSRPPQDQMRVTPRGVHSHDARPRREK
jgi:DNA-nicking Smr family endonuclease